MGSRVLLSVLLFAVALAAGSLYWLSRGGAPQEVAQGSRRVPEASVPAAEELSAPAAAAAEERLAVAAERGQAGPVAASERTERPERPGRPGEGVVRGRVVDGQGLAIPAAVVLASDRPGGLPLDLAVSPDAEGRLRAETDAEGRFELHGMQPGTARFLVRASGFVPLRDDDVPLSAGAPVELAPFVMTRGAILSGRVIDPAGRGVAGARLTVERERSGIFLFGAAVEPDATSAEDGSFRLDQVACGPWRVRVVADEHPARTFEGTAERPGEEIGGLELRLGEAARIAGRVQGVPREEAGELFVSARPARNGDLTSLREIGDVRRADVDVDGSFELRGLLPGTPYLLEARARDDAGPSRLFLEGRSRSNRVRAEAGDRDVLLRYQEGATLTFRVLDARTREPLESFVVRYGNGAFLQPLRDDDGAILREHPEGIARVDRLRLADDQRLGLAVEATGYEAFERSGIAVLAGEVTDLGRIFLEPVPLLRVSVRERDGGEPIEGARVSLHEPPSTDGSVRVEHRISIGGGEDDEVVFGGPSARSDEQGVALLNAPTGEVRAVRVEREGYARWESEPIRFPAGEDVELEARLGPGGTLLVRALTADGEPLAGAHVQHRAPAELASGALSLGTADGARVTDAAGELRMENLEPGLHAVRLQEGDAPSAFFGGGEAVIEMRGAGPAQDEGWSEVEVAEGGTSTVVLTASPRGTLEGRIDEAGVPLAGASLSLVAEERAGGPMAGFTLPGMGGGPRTRTDGHGRYRFEDVKEGRYRLRIEHSTRHMPHESPTRIREGANHLDVSLGVTVLEGRVTSTDGGPLAGVRVAAERAGGDGRTTHFVMVMESSDGGTVVGGDGGLGGAEVATDGDGRYRLRGVPGDVDLRVRAWGDAIQETRSDVVRVAEGDTRGGVDLACPPAGSVEIQAVTPDGSPARFCLVNATWAGDPEEVVVPKFAFLESGSTVLGGLRPGPWDFVVTPQSTMGASGGEPSGTETQVEVVAGERLTRMVQLN